MLGFNITRDRRPRALTTPDGGTGGWFPVIREPWAGGFQQNISIDAPREILAFSAVFHCVTGIATDIAKLCLEVMTKDANGIGVCVEDTMPTSPFVGLLYKPNSYQTQYQFLEQWCSSKQLHGNTYALKKRDGRNMVRELFILDPTRVQPLIADDGSIYYKLSKNPLAELEDSLVVAASEIIHDRQHCIWHPLVGVSSIYACAMSATMGNRIQGNSTRFFRNQSRPSGMLTAPGTIDDVTANRLKKTFEDNFSGENMGRLFVGGDGLEYSAMQPMSAVDAELVKQLEWTVADVARAFRYPVWKMTGVLPQRMTVENLNQIYYDECLHGLIQALEASLGMGLELPSGYYVEFDLEGLLRMDAPTRYKAKSDAVGGGWMAPNEARKGERLGPVPGGNTPYLQEQNYSLEALAKRDAKPDPFETAGVGSAPGDSAPSPEDTQHRSLTLELLRQIASSLASSSRLEDEDISDEDMLIFDQTVRESLHA